MARVIGHNPGLLRWHLSLTGDPGFLCLAPQESPGAASLSYLITEAALGDWAALRDDPSSCLALKWLRVEAGWPLLGADFDPGERVLPQTGLEQHVVSTTKGCYLGQEVVARIRTYGSVPQALRGLVFPGLDLAALDGFPEPGRDLCDDSGRVVGTWASCAWSATRQVAVALAFLDRESRTPGRLMTIQLEGEATASAEVHLLPLYSALDHSERARNLYGRAQVQRGAGR